MYDCCCIFYQTVLTNVEFFNLCRPADWTPNVHACVWVWYVCVAKTYVCSIRAILSTHPYTLNAITQFDCTGAMPMFKLCSACIHDSYSIQRIFSSVFFVSFHFKSGSHSLCVAAMFFFVVDKWIAREKQVPSCEQKFIFLINLFSFSLKLTTEI